jgi:hypothetical protein
MKSLFHTLLAAIMLVSLAAIPPAAFAAKGKGGHGAKAPYKAPAMPKAAKIPRSK